MGRFAWSLLDRLTGRCSRRRIRQDGELAVDEDRTARLAQRLEAEEADVGLVDGAVVGAGPGLAPLGGDASLSLRLGRGPAQEPHACLEGEDVRDHMTISRGRPAKRPTPRPYGRGASVVVFGGILWGRSPSPEDQPMILYVLTSSFGGQRVQFVTGDKHRRLGEAAPDRQPDALGAHDLVDLFQRQRPAGDQLAADLAQDRQRHDRILVAAGRPQDEVGYAELDRGAHQATSVEALASWIRRRSSSVSS